MANSHSRTSAGKATRNPIRAGDKFGRLTAISAGHLVQGPNQRETFIPVRCDCGVEKDVRAVSLKAGVTRSCGCGIADAARVSVVERSTTHGMSKSAIYGVYRTMLSRCYNPSVERYPMYGGRGIGVCDRWRVAGGVENFLADMGPRPSGYSIERENQNGDYEPNNCRWASSKEQANNTRRNRVVEWNGESLTVSQWADRTGIGGHTILFRLRKGWEIGDALSRPVRGKAGVRRGT